MFHYWKNEGKQALDGLAVVPVLSNLFITVGLWEPVPRHLLRPSRALALQVL